MTIAVFMALMAAFFGAAVWHLYLDGELARQSGSGKSGSTYAVIVISLGVIAHILCAVSYYGHKTDMACFSGWSSKIFTNGLAAFYASEGFHDYPPGYVYVMYILGAVKETLHLENGALWLWLKLPSIAADTVMAVLSYKLARKRFSDAVSSVFAALIIFNPAVITDSAVWGQIDGILALLCLMAVYNAAERRFIPSFFWLASGVLVKPQALFVAPVIAFALIDDLFISNKFEARKLIKYILGAVAAVAAMLILFMPFGKNPVDGIKTIIAQYLQTLGEYEYMTVNAFNFYAAIGKNWAPLSVGTKIFGYAAMAAAVAYSGYVFFRSKSAARCYIASFILIFGVYMFGIKMHERYAFTSIFMLMFALIISPSSKTFWLYLLFSLSQMYNMAWSLFVYDASNYYSINGAVAPAGFVNIALFALAVYYIQTEGMGAVQTQPSQKRKEISVKYKKGSQKPLSKKEETFSFKLTEKAPRLTRIDLAVMAVIIVVYSIIAFHSLGNKFAPQTELTLSSDPVTVDMGEEMSISQTQFFLGARQLDDNRAIVFRYLDSDGTVVSESRLTSGSVFYWDKDETAVTARYIELSTDHTAAQDDPTDLIYIREVAVLDKNNEIIRPINYNNNEIAALFDEQEMFVYGKSFMSETYFDEIYHARTAYEFIRNMTVYEWTHPPLGKVLISIGIRIFGMVPFGWRIVGTVFGIFMIPIIYLFARRLLKHTWLAVVVCLLFTFDFMHFTQTRIATIDVYVTFFIMLMYYFMYKYYTMSFYDTPLKNTLMPLGLSGIFFGFAVACKWTGLYAGLGLAIIFFYTLYTRYIEYRYAASKPKGETSGISHEKVISGFKRNTAVTLAFCVLMFVIIPSAIYAMSYIPYLKTPSGHGIGTIFENARSMMTYHSKTIANSTHPYSSHWYEWPIMYRPLWYFSNTTPDGLKQGISAFGNPAVWWLGIGAFAYTAALAVMIPLRERGYLGMNKYAFLGIYAAAFAVICAVAYTAGTGNEKLERLFACVLFYSAVMVTVFALVLAFDEFIGQRSGKTALFLVIAYLTQFAPWIPITRTTYIYHYFPSVVFVVLMLGYTLKTFYDNAKNKRSVIAVSFAYAAAAVGLFILFYPVISGKPIDGEFAKTWLKWFSSWVLV